MDILSSSQGADQAPSGPALVGLSSLASSLGIHASIVVGTDVNPRHLSAVSRRFQLQGFARSLLPEFRVSSCLRYVSGVLVDLYHHPEFSSASYGGLQTCGSVHVCSCCGTKVSERRAAEISSAVSAWSDRGGSVLMATFTLQHSAADTLSSVAGVMNEAYRYMRSVSGWRTFASRLGLVGSITAREYTYGSSGWHPHLHALLFVGSLSERKSVATESWLRLAWSSSITKFGRYAHPQVGVTCRLGDSAAGEYVSKQGRSWTVGDELAKANRKLGRRGGHTPPQLLWLSGLGVDRAGDLFREYAAWTYRKNALVWSPGLRKLLGLVDDKSDEEVAAELTAGGRLLVQFDRRQWRVILANDLRAEVLMVAAAGEVVQVADFLAGFGIELSAAQLAEVVE